MRYSIGMMACGLLFFGSSALAIDLSNLNSVKSKALLDQVNKELAQQQVKDGQFEFVSGKAEFAPGNEKRVKGLLKVMTQHSSTLKRAFPAIYVVSEGHTDSVGKADANKKLSMARAETVCRALKAEGLKFKCKAVGVGSGKPLVSPEKSAADKQRNRRVLVQMAE